MIRFINLEKRFGRNKVLKGIDLDLSQMGITAVLGPNGSGKTTLLKCFLGMVIPNSGNIQFKNESILGQHLYRSEISHVSQIVYFPENLTPRELIQMAKDLRPGKTREAYFIELFELSSEMNKKMSTLSGGTRQKINLLLGLMHDNQVIILDEPSNGLDPVSFLNLKSFLKQEGKNKQILITTHTMSFVEEIADHIVFLLNGQIYFQGKLTDLLAQEDRSDLESAIANIIQQKKSTGQDA